MKTRRLTWKIVGFSTAIVLCALILKQSRNQMGQHISNVELNRNSASASQAARPSSRPDSKMAVSALPPSSGDSYHAYELLRHPDRDLGKLVELDPYSVPVINPRAPGFVTYIKLRPNEAVLAGMVGLRYANDISTDVSVFDVRVEDTSGTFTQGTDIITVGQIAVQLNGPNRTPNPLRIWDVEPKGTIEGTTAAGITVRVPLMRFWRYHDTHLDEPEPKVIPIPPQVENSAAGDVPRTEADRRVRADREYASAYEFVSKFGASSSNQELRVSIKSFLADLDQLRQTPYIELLRAIRNGETYKKHWIIDDRVTNTEESLDHVETLLNGRDPMLVSGTANYLTNYGGYIQKNEQRILSLQSKYQIKLSEQTSSCTAAEQVNTELSELQNVLTLASNPTKGAEARLIDMVHASMLQGDLNILLPCYREGT